MAEILRLPEKIASYDAPHIDTPDLLVLVKQGLVDERAGGDVLIGNDGAVFLRMSSTIRPQVRQIGGTGIDFERTDQGALESLFTHAVIDDNYIMKHGEFLLGLTNASIQMPTNYLGLFTDYMFFIDGSRVEEMIGLRAQTAAKVSPGFNGNLVLEIGNVTGEQVILKPKNMYSMIQLSRVIGAQESGSYDGQYTGQADILLPNVSSLGY